MTGPEFKSARELAGFSIRGVAKAGGFAHSVLVNWEKGPCPYCTRGRPASKRLQGLALGALEKLTRAKAASDLDR